MYQVCRKPEGKVFLFWDVTIVLSFQCHWLNHIHLIFSMALCLLTGVASVVVSFFLAMYYNVINAWGFWYFFHSFQVS